MRDVAYIALGSNVGDRAGYLALARQGLAAIPRSRLRAVSSIEETLPLGPVPQGPYLNQMAALETDLDPDDLLDALHAIEQAAGRVRRERWGPRTLDLDIVLFENERVSTPRLVVPHPALPERDFWQRGLGELRGGG
jgi:2-amino-4-hydroxy-6-hydroxymethyldihydropteridine diphosphokinase